MCELNGYRARELSMGCPDDCEHRRLILQQDSVLNARYQRRKRWEDAT